MEEEKKLEPINFETKYIYDGENIHAVAFGNTGLRIERTGNSWHMHFYPDRYSSRYGKGNPIKYGTVFGAALSALVDWWRNEDNFSENFPRMNFLRGATVKSMHQFRQRLLNLPDQPPVYEETTTHDSIKSGTLFSYKLHLDGLVSNADLMGKIRKMRENCVTRGYIMEPA
ncbi:hypothetical protein A2630_00765 [Candidatus Woesebacteria bacterium RIFCSPHIGHO2_01_FULL_44_10]|uniref:Uncharacterized protein n=1 Tax=Candidatus Woesebacteria bacterium RIFCSPLOWO2_01_FULL_44_14 TaxID=1802525 RepID=A0A1F8C3M5_9BACT|nr:MAG: hypothetical protein A2630_00765 [Candidatus Woesebacteria bacterium RIFCSPHIGHO2_01_FULL_44_10]OGM54346.1 MAG: hypothetical protein A3F62_01160 [Candidatus Woesebacteria bacterium RIFCSPHIGHO2_12_FULL_44_11]OGM70248.1 MAG: hypothetical protein A2975_04210 [Candidatus Woesebacteria bacterium RIFCSPLOWO2_01_FULL_44_14]